MELSQYQGNVGQTHGGCSMFLILPTGTLCGGDGLTGERGIRAEITPFKLDLDNSSERTCCFPLPPFLAEQWGINYCSST